jgi:hypothetical protein
MFYFTADGLCRFDGVSLVCMFGSGLRFYTTARQSPAHGKPRIDGWPASLESRRYYHWPERADAENCRRTRRRYLPTTICKRLLRFCAQKARQARGSEACVYIARITGPHISSSPAMQCRVAYEYSLNDAPEDFVTRVPSQVVDDVPANIPRALLPEYIVELLRQRSPQIARIRHLRIL